MPTPCVAVSYSKLVANLDRVAALAQGQGVALRPHVKTHKCLEIAALQAARGAIGFTASKPQEALTFIEWGASSVTVAYPIVVSDTARALHRAGEATKCDLRFVVDSVESLRVIAATAMPSRLARVYLEIDVGLERCGVKPDSPALDALARELMVTPAVEFRGLLSHAGHAYAADSLTAIAAIADAEREQLARVRDRLAKLGLSVAEVSVGSTPTVLGARSLAGATEIRPGNYVFLDATACRLGVADLDQVALGVVSTIVSVNPRYAIIDAGSKVLSSDCGPHGTGDGAYGTCVLLDRDGRARGRMHTVRRLSEEHGFVEHGGAALPIGARMLVLPSHACPVVNLADRLVVLHDDRPSEFWSVAARGKSA